MLLSTSSMLTERKSGDNRIPALFTRTSKPFKSSSLSQQQNWKLTSKMWHSFTYCLYTSLQKDWATTIENKTIWQLVSFEIFQLLATCSKARSRTKVSTLEAPASLHLDNTWIAPGTHLQHITLEQSIQSQPWRMSNKFGKISLLIVPLYGKGHNQKWNFIQSICRRSH